MKNRDRRPKQDSRRKLQEKRAGKQELHAKQQTAAEKAVAAARERTKRSGVDAVKLHLEVTGGTGRTSRSATAVRKTSIRMAAIKEYPFDLSDLRNQPPVGGDTTQSSQTVPPATHAQLTVTAPDGKRKVSIMADESSKDRENLPSESYDAEN